MYDTREAFCITDHLPRIGKPAMQNEVFLGLKDKPRQIDSKYFYDSRGSELFEEITRLEEYYPTRTEKTIIEGLWERMDPEHEPLHIVELGSGDSSKFRLLLSGIPPSQLPLIGYYPVDISKEAIAQATENLLNEFPPIRIHGLVLDFVHQLHLLPRPGNRLFCFFGSTIGNLDIDKAYGFMAKLGGIMEHGECLLLGLDMIKSKALLERAYNDSRGVTEKFNKNILMVANRLLEADFEPEAFDHLAFYNQEARRVEMHLRARKPMDIHCGFNGKRIRIQKHECIHTENSYKFSPGHIHELGNRGGLRLTELYSDPASWFSLACFEKTHRTPK